MTLDDTLGLLSAALRSPSVVPWVPWPLWELAGWIASALVLVAFYMKSMVWLRVVALLSNLAFIVYGLALNLPPIWLLHALLMPLNWLRLVEATRARPLPHAGAGAE
jgi:hypothetical protein